MFTRGLEGVNFTRLRGGQETSKKQDIKRKIDNTIIKDKNVKNDKKLQEFAQQGEVIGDLSKELTKEGLKGYRPFSAIGIFDSGKRDVSDDIKKQDEKIKYMNHTYAWQCSYDMEEMIKKYENYLRGFKEVRDLFLKQKEKRESISAKKFDDASGLVESLQKQTSARATDVKEQSDEIQKVEVHRIKQYNKIKLYSRFGRYKNESMKRIEEIKENITKLKEQYEIANGLKAQIGNIASKLVEEQREKADKQVKELDQLCNHQKELRDKLDKAIKAEEDYCQHIGNICDKINPNGKSGDNIKEEEVDQLKNCVQKAQKAEQDLDSACKGLLQENPGSADLAALKRLHKILNEDTSDQIKDMIEQGETYLYIHAPAGKVVINGIFWHMSRIEEVTSPSKDKTKIQLDTNRANLVIDTFTKDGLQTTEHPYVKTLADGSLEAENFRLRFVAPFAGGTKRPEAKLIIERRQEDGKWEVNEQDVNLATLRTIRVRQDFSGDKVKVTVWTEDDVTPDLADIELQHNNFVSYKPGFEAEKAQRMYMMHLPSRSIIFPNGRRRSFDDFKWNALRDDGDGIGLKCRGQGPTVDLPYFSVSMAGQDLQSRDMMKNTNKLNTEIRNHLSSAFELLEDAIEKDDENHLNRTFCRIENDISRNISQLEILRNAYYDPPKDRDHRPQEKIEAIDSEVSQVSKFLRGSKELYDAVGNFDKELNERIQGIDLEDHKRKKELWGEFKDVYDLEETFKVGQLDDPKLGAYIEEIARKAGEAAYTIEKVKSPGTAEKAQVDAENTTTKEFIKAYNAYLKVKDNREKALGAFYTAMQGIVQRTIILQAKAEIVKNGEKYTREGGDINEVKNKFIKKHNYSALEAEKAKIVKEQKGKIISYIKSKNLKDPIGEKDSKIKKYTKKIDKEVEEAIRISKAKGENEYKQYECAIKAAIETAFMLEKYESDKDGIILEGEKNINNAVKKAKKESKAKGENEYKQYECAIKAAIETAFMLEKHKNGQSGIEQENSDNVEDWYGSAVDEFGKTLERIGQVTIEKILNSAKEQDKEGIKKLIEEAKEKCTEENKIQQHKLAIEKAIEIYFNLEKYKNIQENIKDEDRDDVEKLVKDAHKEFDKTLEIAERAAIKTAFKKYIELEDREGVDEQVEDACKKLKKAMKDANSSAEKKWKDANERGNIVARTKLDKVEEDAKKEIENKEKDKGELSESEKDAIRLMTAVKNAYDMKDKVDRVSNTPNQDDAASTSQPPTQQGGEIDGIPRALQEEGDSANNEIKKMAEEWAQKLPEGDHTRVFDGARLMRERRRLKSYAKDPSGNLSQRCDHFLKQAKLKQIEDIIDTDPKVHYSYRIMLNMARAYEAALEGNYLGKSEKNVKIEGALHYLGRVKTEVESHKTDGLGKLRADFLHQVVKFVRSDIEEARHRQASRMLLPVLARAQRVLEADLDKLELVKQVLDPETPEDEAKKIKDVLKDKLSDEGRRSALDLDRVEGAPKKVARDIIKEVEDRLMKNGRFDFEELEKLRPSAIRAWRGKILQNFHKQAETIFESTLNGLNNEQRAIMEQNRASLIDNTTKRLWEDYQKLEDKSFQLHKIGKFTEEVNKQRWKDAIISWLLTSMNNVTQISDRGVNIFTKELEKLMKV